MSVYYQNYRKVARNYDDSDCPLVGVILWQEDEDRVAVAWGDAMFYNYEIACDMTRIEFLDELRPYNRMTV